MVTNIRYIEETSIEYRKQYGQFFTPKHVAGLMTNWIIKSKPKSVLDPAFGLGIFYDVLKNNYSSEQIDFTGYELDKNILKYLEYKNSPNLKIYNEDYLDADVGKFDAIICNPPYMRFQNFYNRHDILPKLEKKLDIKLVGYSNIASVFLVKSLNELNKNGRLAYIMPFEFFNTGYGEEIKKELIEKRLLKHIVIFENEKDIFPEAITTVSILFCHNNGKNEDIKVSIVKSEDDINNLNIDKLDSRRIHYLDMPANKKWSPIISSLFTKYEYPTGFCKINQYGKFMRGIATGANEFFALNKTKISKLGISENNIKKCITRSELIKQLIFSEDDFNKLAQNDKNVYCLDVNDPDDKAVIKYLDEGKKIGVHKRYLPSKRNPWYKLEKRQPAPILFGVFNRGRLKVVRNYSDAINFTCFHSFYPNLIGINYVEKLFVYFISDIGQKVLKINKRSYGKNLDKLEPGDLNESLFPNIDQFNLIKIEEVDDVIETAKNDMNLAITMSNELIKRTVNNK